MEKLDDYLNGCGVDSSDSFLHFMRKRIMECPVSETTRKKHLYMLKKLEEFGRIKAFSDIN